jgi:hypothetical protein
MAAGNIPMASFTGSPIQWTVPSQWKTLPPTQIRKGNFEATADGKKAEITVTTFPGTVGGELENVNRWRQQVGLAPATQDQIVSKPVTVDDTAGKVYDLSGDAEGLLVASVFRDGNTWFFKVKGPKDLVAAQQSAFSEFLKSVKFGASAAQAQPSQPAGLDASADPHAALGAGDPHIAPALPSPNEQTADLPKWIVPANWSEKTPGPMILKSYSVAGKDGKTALVTISMFPGQVGGVLANVNRWRGQLGLPEVSESDLATATQATEVPGGKATLVDLTGSDRSGQPARLIAAMVPHGDSTWFYKLLGDTAVVGSEKNNFVHFLQTVQYP